MSVKSSKRLPSNFTDAYREMMDSCYNPYSLKYKKEGFMAIKVCDEWANNFSKFKEDMYPSYLKATR